MFPQDDAGAARWCRRAAEQGHAEAQCELGGMYASGLGVPEDEAETVKWNLKGAGQSHDGAQGELGSICENGWGVAQDNVQAHIWYSLAAAQGGDATPNLAEILVRHMTPGQIAEAQRLAREWRPKK